MDEVQDYFPIKKSGRVCYWAAQVEDECVVAGFPDGPQGALLPGIHTPCHHPHLPYFTRVGLCNREWKGGYVTFKIRL